jgi:predicted lipoprotein with Yx(FWY)xxD motif
MNSRPSAQRPAHPLGRFARQASVAALAGMTALGLSVLTAGPATAKAKAKAKATRDTVKLVSHQGLGKILVDAGGMAVYVFSGDHPNKATCSGGCASVWPPLTIAKGAKLTGGPGVKHLGTIASGARRQVTWNKHPLYLYALDTSSGVVNGNGVKMGSYVWYAATSSRVNAKWNSSPPTTSSGSPPATGYGY